MKESREKAVITNEILTISWGESSDKCLSLPSPLAVEVLTTGQIEGSHPLLACQLHILQPVLFLDKLHYPFLWLFWRRYNHVHPSLDQSCLFCSLSPEEVVWGCPPTTHATAICCNDWYVWPLVATVAAGTKYLPFLYYFHDFANQIIMCQLNYFVN